MTTATLPSILNFATLVELSRETLVRRRASLGDHETMSQSIHLVVVGHLPTETGALLLLCLNDTTLFTDTPRSVAEMRQQAVKFRNRRQADTAVELVKLNVRERLVEALKEFAQEAWGWDPALFVERDVTTQRHEAKEVAA